MYICIFIYIYIYRAHLTTAITAATATATTAIRSHTCLNMSLIRQLLGTPAAVVRHDMEDGGAPLCLPADVIPPEFWRDRLGVRGEARGDERS